eukprot:2466915-Lingulodinium_polyedra.AAC.1
MGAARTKVASHAWGMLRNGAALLREVLDATPQGAFLLIVGGVPLPRYYPRWASRGTARTGRAPV